MKVNYWFVSEKLDFWSVKNVGKKLIFKWIIIWKNALFKPFRVISNMIAFCLTYFESIPLHLVILLFLKKVDFLENFGHLIGPKMNIFSWIIALHTLMHMLLNS